MRDRLTEEGVQDKLEELIKKGIAEEEGAGVYTIAYRTAGTILDRLVVKDKELEGDELRCDICDEVIKNEDVAVVGRYDDFKEVCDSCAGENYFHCNKCEEPIHNNEMHRDGRDEPICTECAEEELITA